jgi:hypothetical protein
MDTLDGVAMLDSIACRVTTPDIYKRVEFAPTDDLAITFVVSSLPCHQLKSPNSSPAWLVSISRRSPAAI